MKFDPGILRNYDIRGEYGKDFDDEFAERLGAALVIFLHAKKLIVARDMRPSSDMLVAAIVKGITEAGCDVIDIGTASTPFFYYAVTQHDVPAGIMVTASHMGPTFNGFKICKQDAMCLGKDSGLLELSKVISDVPVPGEVRGSISQADYKEEHAEKLITIAGLQKGNIKQKISIEADPMILQELAVVFSKLDIQPIATSWDIKFAFDPDGDRLTVYNASGKQIRADLIAGVLALRLAKGTSVIADLRASRGVTDYLQQEGITLIPSKIGHTNIKKIMKERDVVYGGEASGHMMFRAMRYSESTQLALLMLLKIMADEGTSIDALVAPMDTWSHSGEINTPIEGWPASVKPILEKVKATYQDGKMDELDGLRVDYPDWWLLLRASGTEPVIRLIVEARTKSLMDEKIKKVQTLIKA